VSIATLVLSLADNKQLLGMRYAEWATLAPSLEADIAAAAMGLDDIGHSRVLFGCLDALGEDPRTSDREHDPSAYLNLPYLDQPWTEWDQFVAANAVLDTAFTVFIQACVEGDLEVLQSRLRKMLIEERYHYLHGRSWLKQGVDQAVLAEAWVQALQWFGPDDGEVAELNRQGHVAASPAQLRQRLEARLESKPPAVELDWTSWDPRRRRVREGSIDERTFEMLRGLEERRFAPAGTGGDGGSGA
jgi:1,2-phenylacetyl-CoA epoxidase catalytic subunit